MVENILDFLFSSHPFPHCSVVFTADGWIMSHNVVCWWWHKKDTPHID